MSAMVNHGALIRTNPLERNDDPDCPNCRGQGSIIALWNYIDPSQVTQPGATNLWTGENTWDDLIQDVDSESTLSLSEGHIPQQPDASDTVLTNHGQSNPGQLVEPDSRQAFQTAEQTTNHGRHIPVYHQMGTPNVSRVKVRGELQIHPQEVPDLDEIALLHTELFRGPGQLVSIAHVIYHQVVSSCYQAHI